MYLTSEFGYGRRMLLEFKYFWVIFIKDEFSLFYCASVASLKDCGPSVATCHSFTFVPASHNPVLRQSRSNF